MSDETLRDAIRDAILADVTASPEKYPVAVEAFGTVWSIDIQREAINRSAEIAATVAAAHFASGDAARWGFLKTDNIGSYANAKLMWVRRFGSPLKNPARFWRGGDDRVHTDLLGYTHVAAIDDIDLIGYEFCEAAAPGWTMEPQEARDGQ